MGRTTSSPEAGGTTTEASYNALSDQGGFAYGAGSDAGIGAGVASSYDHDVGGRVIEQNDGFACTAFTYDYRDLALTVEEGLDAGEAPCDGTPTRTTTNTYDSLGRLTYAEARDGSDAFESSRTFVYDSAGNVLASTSTVGSVETTVSYGLNNLDQIVSETAPDGSTATTTYDAARNTAKRTTGAGIVTYTYDARNHLIELVDEAAGSTAVYDPDHNYQMSAFYLGTKADGSHEHQTLYSYDGRHRLVTVLHQQCNSVGANHACAAPNQTGRDEYAYDLNDNRTHVTEWKNSSSSSTDYFYCYDSSDQLTRRQSGTACSSSDYDQKYVYDAAGNRTKTVVGGTTTDFAYNADGQLCKVGGTSCSSANVTYGAAGRTKTGNGWNFRYDAQGRLATACRNSGCTSSADKVEFTYDAAGRRTKVKTTPGGGSTTTVTYRYQGSAVVEEKTGSTVTRQYVLDDSGAVVKMIIPSGQANAGTYLVTWNGHGDALALYRIFTTGTLQLANSFSYSTWGSPTTTTHNGYGDLGFRYLYVGQYGVAWDDWFGLGLYYMSARHYAPELGRFIQPRHRPPRSLDELECGVPRLLRFASRCRRPSRQPGQPCSPAAAPTRRR